MLQVCLGPSVGDDGRTGSWRTSRTYASLQLRSVRLSPSPGGLEALFAANTRWSSPWWAHVCSTRMFRAILTSKFRATGSEQLEILMTDARLLDTDILTILESKFRATGRKLDMGRKKNTSYCNPRRLRKQCSELVRSGLRVYNRVYNRVLGFRVLGLGFRGLGFIGV